jgi:hypothetical protein
VRMASSSWPWSASLGRWPRECETAGLGVGGGGAGEGGVAPGRAEAELRWCEVEAERHQRGRRRSGAGADADWDWEHRLGASVAGGVGLELGFSIFIGLLNVGPVDYWAQML